jgi:hypothetical protein
MTTETPEQIEIRELRALLAAEEAEEAEQPELAAPLIAKGTASRLVPGDQVYFVATGLMLRTGGESFSSASIVGHRGQTITLTQALIDANTNTAGLCAFDLVDDPDAQAAKWGEQKIARGPAPEGMTTWMRGTVEEDIARERALAAAYALPDDERRARELAEVRRTFGTKKTSQTISEWGFSK